MDLKQKKKTKKKVGTAFDIPCYPVLITDYVCTLLTKMDISLTWFEQWLINLFLVLLGALVNICNLRTLGNTSIVSCIVIFIPLMYGFVIAAKNIDPKKQWNINSPSTDSDGDSNAIQFGLLLNSALWLYSGFHFICFLFFCFFFLLPFSSFFCVRVFDVFMALSNCLQFHLLIF